MIINEIVFTPFALKLKKPFQNSYSVIHERKGFIIKCTDELGNIGLGECSPLPGLSKETLDDSEHELTRIARELKEKYFSDEFPILELPAGGISTQFSIQSDFSSVQFGVEQAIISLMMYRDKSFFQRYFGKSKSVIDVNAVVGLGEVDSILTQVKMKIAAGYKTIKLKIGREDPFDDFYLIVTIRNVLGYDFKLRLDANRKWSADEAIEYLNRLQEYDIEYVEEPCEFICSTLRTVEESVVPVALDESIESVEKAEELITNCKAGLIVLKPMIVGGFLSTYRLIREAEKQNKSIIISSSFESPIGKSGLTLLSSLTNHSYAHGLDTSDFFETNICNDPYIVENGTINFDPNKYPPKFSL